MPGDRDNTTQAAARIPMVSTREPGQSVALSTPGRQWHRAADIMVASAADFTVAPPVAEVASTVAVVVATVADAKN